MKPACSTVCSVVTIGIVQPEGVAPYSLEELAGLAGLPGDLVSRFVQDGLLEPMNRLDAPCWEFDADALLTLRRIKRLRRDLGVNLAGIGVILHLLEQIEELRRELERLRRD